MRTPRHCITAAFPRAGRFGGRQTARAVRQVETGIFPLPDFHRALTNPHLGAAPALGAHPQANCPSFASIASASVLNAGAISASGTHA